MPENYYSSSSGADAVRRHRARRRGEDVPLRQRGRPRKDEGPPSWNATPGSPEDDEEFTSQVIAQVARDVYRFAGMFKPEDCARLRAALEAPLQRLDQRVQAGGKRV